MRLYNIYHEKKGLLIDNEKLKTNKLDASSKMVDYNKLLQDNNKLKKQIRDLNSNYIAAEKEVIQLKETISVNSRTVQQIKDCFSKIKE